MQYIKGKEIANLVLEDLKSKIEKLKRKPQFGIIKVGHDDATEIYVKHKVADATKIGIKTEVFSFDSINLEELNALIGKLNQNNLIDGYIIQLPFKIRGGLKEILHNIDFNKDVDGLNPTSLGATWQDRSDLGFLPATVLGVKKALEYVVQNGAIDINAPTEQIKTLLNTYLIGKNVVIINDSLIVGRPLAGVLLNLGATVSICHKNTKDLAQYTSRADIVISATGRVGLITAEMIKKNAILIDVGIKRVGDKIMGDIDETSVKSKAAWLTPVPNGIGPLTRAMLLQNVYDAHMRRI